MTTDTPAQSAPDLCVLLSQASHALTTRMAAALGEVGISPRGHCVLYNALGSERSQGELAELCALENESAVLSALDRPNFQADSRWVASMVGIPLDEVNVTLQRLLRKRMVTMSARTRWERL